MNNENPKALFKTECISMIKITEAQTRLMFFLVVPKRRLLDLIHWLIKMDMHLSTETLRQTLPTWFESDPKKLDLEQYEENNATCR